MIHEYNPCLLFFYMNFAYATEEKKISVQGAAARQTVPVKLCIIVIALGDV